jgi:hypothetical protein
MAGVEKQERSSSISAFRLAFVKAFIPNEGTLLISY